MSEEYFAVINKLSYPQKSISSILVKIDGLKMMEISLMDTVLATIGVLLAISVLSCIGCLYIKLSDLHLKNQIVKTAQKKGINIDPELLEKRQTLLERSEHRALPEENESTCIIILPDMALAF